MCLSIASSQNTRLLRYFRSTGCEVFAYFLPAQKVRKKIIRLRFPIKTLGNDLIIWVARFLYKKFADTKSNKTNSC